MHCSPYIYLTYLGFEAVCCRLDAGEVLRNDQLQLLKLGQKHAVDGVTARKTDSPLAKEKRACVRALGLIL